jgi:amidohydrolase
MDLQSKEIPMHKEIPPPDQNWLVDVRRDLHKHPELSYEENRTSGKVANILSESGYRVRKGVAKTGVVAVLGNPERPCLAFRADMDALPIQEPETPMNSSYRSVHNGVMHACGHDAHTTIMLGMARVLAENPGFLDDAGICVKFLFQPAEEGGAGARRMIDEGALDDPRPRALLAGHVFSELEVGWAGLSESLSHASADSFHVKVMGRGGHGAHPDQCRDPIVAASHLVSQLQTIVSRWIDPLESAVVTIGRIAGGSTFNVIPVELEMDGTIRSFREETRQLLWDRIQAAAKACEVGFDVTCIAEREEGYPPCVNDIEVSRFLREISSDVLGKDRLEILGPSMGAEDFAYYATIVPSAILRLGCANRAKRICWNQKANSVIGLHSPDFDIDEQVLAVGVRIFTQAVLHADRLVYLHG